MSVPKISSAAASLTQNQDDKAQRRMDQIHFPARLHKAFQLSMVTLIVRPNILVVNNIRFVRVYR